jgi:hypothetical protein
VSYFTRKEIIPKITPDPVFSFNINFHQNINRDEFLKKYDLHDKYILVCISEEYQKKTMTWIKQLKAIASKDGYELVELPRQTGNRVLDIRQIERILNPLEWYNLIRFSKGFIGQLMHPIVISIHNAIPFFCLDHYGRRRFRNFFVDKTTSKTYQVIKQIGKTDRYLNIGGRFSRLPSASFVMNCILSDIINLDTLPSEKMNKKSDESMKRIITFRENFPINLNAENCGQN